MIRCNPIRPRWALAVAIPLVVGLFGGSTWFGRPASLPIPASSPPVPDFEMIGLDGTRQRLDAHRGRVVLLNFWGTSCGPCLAEMPDLEALSETYRDRGLDVLPVCVDESDPKIVASAVGGRLTRLSPRIDAGMGRLRHDVQSTPTTILIGRDGRALDRFEGTRDWTGREFKALIERALNGSM